jgi:GrpB-like predicted nucleotidyltransferase (UPF0157 family)
MAAKPIVDMLAGVRDLELARSAFGPLHEHGYDHAPHRPGITHHFVRRVPDQRSAHAYGLHLTQPESDLWRERLAFRDALRDDPIIAAEYEALKLRLAREHSGDLDSYTAGKCSFVAGVLAGFGIAPGRR